MVCGNPFLSNCLDPAHGELSTAFPTPLQPSENKWAALFLRHSAYIAEPVWLHGNASPREKIHSDFHSSGASPAVNARLGSKHENPLRFMPAPGPPVEPFPVVT